MANEMPGRLRNGRLLAFLAAIILSVAMVVSAFLMREAIQRSDERTTAGRVAAVKDLSDATTREHREISAAVEQLRCTISIPLEERLKAFPDACVYREALGRVQRRP